MSKPPGEVAPPGFLFPDAADFLTPAGQAVNAELPRRRGAGAASPGGRGAHGPGGCRGGGVDGQPAGAGGAQGAGGEVGSRRVPAPVRPVLAGRRHPDVPRRGAAADTRRRDRGPPDRRQAPGRRLGQPHGRQPVAVRQRVHLGPDADRSDRAARRGRRRRAAGRGLAHRRPHGRAGGAHGDQAGDAHHGPPVRDGPDDRRGARQVAEGRQSPLSLHLRHARRGGAHRRRRRAVFRVVCGCHRGAARARRRVCRDSTRAPASRSSSRRCTRASSARTAAGCWTELSPRLVDLCVAAQDAGVALTIDAEESERLELTLELLAATCRSTRLAGLVRRRHRGPGLPEARACGAAPPRRPGARHAGGA